MRKLLWAVPVLGALLLAGCKHDEPVEPVTPETPETPETPDEPEPSQPGIATAQDFIAFAAAVNAGASTEEWENGEGWVNLLADIDFAGVEDWTPVGNATAPWTNWVPAITDGFPFAGKFDGNAHHIKNLHLVCDETVPGKHFGLFGYLDAGAIVQNFVIEENCSLLVKASVSLSAGLIAGVLYDATVRDVTSYAPMTYQGGATGYLHMALIGGLYAKDLGCTVDSVHNYGAIVAENEKNLNAGATGIHVAGIVGFTNAPAGNAVGPVVSSCNNYGDMTSQAGRTAGIVGAANACTRIEDCENRGNQVNSMPKEDGARLGTITCFTNNGSSLSGCKNYGDLVSTTSGRVGGILSLPTAGSYERCANYGRIISDSPYRGVFFGYVNSASAWTECIASGKVGQYNGGEWEYDLYSESNKANYLGKQGAATSTFTDITYDILTGEEEVHPDPSLDVEADFRIFFIGNSFTKDAVEHLPGILAAAGLDKVQMVHMYYGGRTIPEYDSGWSSATDYHCYICNPGQTEWTDVTGKSLAQVAVSAKWDIVTIQEHTGRQLAWGWTDTEKTAVQGLVAKVQAAQKQAGGTPKLYYILSQAYHDLTKAQNVTKPFNNTDEMWSVIAAQGRHAVEECGFDGIISTGAMLQNLRTSWVDNAMGLTRDGYHMDLGIARYGAACTVFETAIGPFNGNIKLDGNTYRTTSGTAVTDQNAPLALKAARYAIEKPYDVTDMSGEEKPGGDEPAEHEQVSVGTVTELAAFADRVNAGDAKALTAVVTLTADLDMASVTDWMPIGAGTFSWASNKLTVTKGYPFAGTFDGGHHTVKNFHQAYAPAEGGGAFGFFGMLADGAVVKDLTFDASCSLTLDASASADCGVLAGMVQGATVSNVVNRGSLNGGGTATLSNARVTMGIIGFAFAAGTETSISDVVNYGAVTATTGGNTANGATAVQVAGIVGFSTNDVDSSVSVKVTRCENRGAITGDTARAAGIVAACNRYTVLTDCTNYADQVNSFPTATNARPGNITCVAGTGVQLIRCVNRGDLISKTSGGIGGVIALVNHATVVMEGCANYGRIISDITNGYHGTLFGQCTVAASFKDCIAAGDYGTYNDGDYVLVGVNADNYFDYVGKHSSAAVNVTKENIRYQAE